MSLLKFLIEEVNEDVLMGCYEVKNRFFFKESLVRDVKYFRKVVVD